MPTKREVAERKRKEKLEREHKIINGIDYKICNKHHIFFPDEDPWLPATTEFFYYHKQNKTDHLYPECRECGKLKTKIWEENNYEQYRENVRKQDINPSPKRREILRNNARQRQQNGKQLQWQRDNPDKCRQYSKLHRNHDITKTEEEALLKIFNYSCAYCGMTLEEHKIKFNEKLHNDHVDEDGYNDLRNDVPACKSCNCGKHEDELEDWYPKQKFYDVNKYNKIVWWITEGYKDYIEEKPPYKIIRERDEGLATYHFNLWTIDEKHNPIDIMATGKKRKDLNKYIDKLFLK